MSRRELVSTAKAATEAYNEKDWKAARAVMAPGFIYDEVATGREIEGVDDVISAWRGWAKAFPDSRATFGKTLVDGDTVVLCLRWRGTHFGPLSLPSGEILPTGRTIDFRACQLFRVDGDKVREMTHYFDLLTMLSQIGEAPGAKEKVKVEKTTR